MWLALAVLVVVLAGVAGYLGNRLDHRGTDVTSVGCRAQVVARQRLPSVVTIQVRAPSGQGSGSGEVVRADGYILTNNHVVSAAARSGTITVLFDDGHAEEAHLVGRDVATDLAVLKVDERDDLPTMPWGDSSALAVGQPVVALGAPLGLSATVTTGIVSALGRSVNVPADDGRTALLVSAIQTDAAINPGNSGGALVDCAGDLVGVPTAGATVPDAQGGSSSGSIGIGFAIPSDFARTISDELIAHGTITHAAFGVQVVATSAATSATEGRATSHEGLLVVAVTADGPAAGAGLREGDVITGLDGQRVVDTEQLQALTLTRRPGQTVVVTYVRGGAERDTTVTLGRQPGS